METSHNVVESSAERCVCEGGPSLEVLKDVQRAYEERMELINRTGGSHKLQKQVEVLQSWVSDLVSQNTLLTRTVEELETEVTSRLLLERRKHSERDKKPCGKVSEMKVLNDSLKMENVTKDREIRRLNKDMQQYEQTILTLRKELSTTKYHTPDVSTKDAEVMAEICCSGPREQCRDAEPVKEFGALVRQNSQLYQEPLHQMEISIKPSNENVRSLRQVNVALREEVHAMQRVCAALDEQCHVAALRAQFKDEIIHEMRQQLRNAKAKLKEVSELNSVKLQKERDNENERKASGSFDSLTISCVQQQPRRKRRVRPAVDLGANWDRRSSNYTASGDDLSFKDDDAVTGSDKFVGLELDMVTSTPNLSHEKMPLDESGASIVEHPPSPPLLLTDSSINESYHEFSPRVKSPRQSKNEGSSIHKNDEGVSKISEINKKRKVIGKEGESNDNGNSILILIEAMECDCEDENQDDIGVENDASRDNTVGKGEKLAKPTSKLNTEASIANGRSTVDSGQSNEAASKNRHISLAQITAKRGGENNENSFMKKGIRKEPAVDKNTKKMKRSSEAVSQARLNESLGAPSLAESSASEAARAHALENKLLATMQILKNKEETVRVQAESLSLAEARIASLAARAQHHQAQQTPLFNTRSASTACRVEKIDASCAADLQVMDHTIVNTLRDNLSVIEELYRECFYESAKQEELITMLRRSYLEMRQMERHKSEQIGRLQRVVRTQRCSLERCQDIAMEVENLKSEITNFLNNSQNNDSGVWEREDGAGDATDDLRAIADQLRRLRDMLHTDCTCGLEEENMKLKRINETMEIQIVEMRQRVNDLEVTLQDKDNMEQQYRVQIQEKDRELHQLRAQVDALEAESRDQDKACEALNCKLKEMEALLKDKSSELLSVKRQCETQEANIAELRQEINRADLTAQESGQVREEVSCLSSQVSQWREQLSTTRRRLRALEAELQRAREHCKHLAVHYRDKSQLAAELQSQLEEAQARGAELCGEARRAVCGVRHWLRRQRQRNREQEEKIKHQEMLIQTLQHQDAADPRATNDNEPCCSKYLTRVEATRSDRSFVSASETGCSKCASAKVVVRTSESEMASSPAPPTPPRRLLRKKAFCGDIRCQWPMTRDSSVQRPSRSDAGVNARLSSDQLSSYAATPTREMSPTDELLERVERAHEALTDAHKRWTRGAGPRDGDR